MFLCCLFLFLEIINDSIDFFLFHYFFPIRNSFLIFLGRGGVGCWVVNRKGLKSPLGIVD